MAVNWNLTEWIQLIPYFCILHLLLFIVAFVLLVRKEYETSKDTKQIKNQLDCVLQKLDHIEQTEKTGQLKQSEQSEQKKDLDNNGNFA
jgi:hypothetical protein